MNSLVATKINTVTRQGWTYQAVIFTPEEFPRKELFCALHYCHVFEEGPPENFFDQNDEEVQPANVAPLAIPEAEVAIKLDHAKDIEFV